MEELHRYSINYQHANLIGSLRWSGDYLIDRTRMGTKFHLSGEMENGIVNFGYKFDATITSDDGLYEVIYERLGTKGLVVHRGTAREINRSYYHAEAYEYPVALFRREGVVYLAHCPEKYNVIEIEDAATGLRLTKKRPSRDFFQSRLQASPGGRWLMSAGWVWHPVDGIELYDLSKDLANPMSSSPFWDEGFGDIGLWEVNNAVFIDDSTLVLSGSGDTDCEDGNPEKAIVVFDLDKRSIISRAVIEEETGKIMPIDHDFAISFFRNPKLIELKTGKIIRRWDDIATDEQNSSICHHTPVLPMALDPINRRFAVATSESIEVVILGE